jgi:hypothetical protein
VPHISITDAEVLALKPKAKPYRVYIGKGAFILVRPDGAKYWRLKYWLAGKQNECSLGVFPKVSVDAAKAARDSAKALIREGINPAVARREARLKSLPAHPVFRFTLSKTRALTIETGTNALKLTVRQTQALAGFLAPYSKKGKESR